MKVRPMHEGRAGDADLVHHTVKHFFDRNEWEAWDRLPVPHQTAEAWSRSAPRPLPVGDPVDRRWWQPPSVFHVRRAHDGGYEPRYRLLVEVLGGLDSGRWAAQRRGRWVGDCYGFRVVADARPGGLQVVTAYWSCVYRADDHPSAALPAFQRAAARLSARGAHQRLPSKA